MAAPSVLDHEVTTATGSSSIDATIPAGTVSGNGLVAILGNDTPNSTADEFPDTITGWNRLFTDGDGGGDCHLAAYVRPADGTEGATQEFTSANANDLWAIVVRLDTMGDVDVVGTPFLTAGLDKDFPSLTTTADDTIVFAVEAFDGGDASWTLDGDDTDWPSSVPSDQIARAGTGGGNGSGYFVTMEQGTAGAVPTLNSVASTFDGRVLNVFAIEAGGGAAPAGTGSVSGSGTVGGSGVRTAKGTTSVAGAGSVAGSGTRTAKGSVSVAGAGTVGGTGAKALNLSGTVAVSGSGSIGAETLRTAKGSSSTSGTGTIGASGSSSTGAAGTVQVGGVGSVSGTGQRTAVASVLVTGAGTVTGAGVRTANGSVSISGTGTIGAASTVTASGTVAISGTGTISASGTIPGQASGTVAIVGTGQIWAVGHPTAPLTLLSSGEIGGGGFTGRRMPEPGRTFLSSI